MANLCISFFLILLATQSLKAKKTNIQFYLQDSVCGNTPSAVKVAEAPTSTKSPTLFGTVLVVDDPLTESPDPNSMVVGRAQGLYVSAAKQELAMLMVLTYEFTSGEFNGSSIVIVGKNSPMDTVWELPVVGGTEVFRLARGYALASTSSYGIGNTIVGYNVTVIHSG